MQRLALVAIRLRPSLRARYLALRKASKPAKAPIVAVMRLSAITARGWSVRMRSTPILYVFVARSKR
jgi:hypothetical protein